jgi:hypothetical protein
VINLNNSVIILFLLTLLSCENANYNKYISDKDFFKTTSTKNNKVISQYNYDFTYSGSEKYEINENLEDFVVYHKSLPIPSVLKIFNPNNLSEYETVKNVFIDSGSNFFEISKVLKNKLSLNSDVYVEYLKDESKNLRSVELSKETSVVDLNTNEIITRPTIYPIHTCKNEKFPRYASPGIERNVKTDVSAATARHRGRRGEGDDSI